MLALLNYQSDKKNNFYPSFDKQFNNQFNQLNNSIYEGPNS